MVLLRAAGRALRRAIALCVLVVIRGRRVLLPVAGLLVVAYVATLYASSPRLSAVLQPSQGRAAVATPAGRGAALTGLPAAGTPAAAPGSVEAAVQRVIERADQEQAQALAAADPSTLRETSTDAYYQEVVRTNQSLKDDGVTAIRLVGIEWGPVTVSGDLATATAYETWTTEYADGATERSRDRNVYALVRQDGVWRIQSDDHPDDAAPTPAAGADPAGRRTDTTAPPAPAATPAAATSTGRGGRSSNWSGYTASGGSFTAVTGAWTVPQPTATGAPGRSAAWVGIGGERSRDLIQAGTEEIVVGPGRVRYDAWIETLPDSARQVSLSVHGGDAVTVALEQQAPGSWRVSFKNETTGAAYEETVRYDSSLSSADWIQEAPSGGRRRGGAALDDFGAVAFSGASAVKDGQRVNLAQAVARPVTLIDRTGQPLAAPSALTADGAGFTVTQTAAAPAPRPTD